MLNVDPCGMATTLLKVHTIQDANKMLMLIAQIFFWSFNIIQPEVGEVGYPKEVMCGLEIRPKMIHKSQ